jgi:heat shock protein HtpX
MARTRYGKDSGLSFRMFGTMFGLGLIYVILAGILLSLGFSAILVLGISGGMLFFQWWFSDSLAMKSMNAVVVTPEQAPQLHAMVDRLCAMADMEKPRLGIADNDTPNAFATGRTSKRAVVVVTTGLLKRLDRDELEGVLAHELSHVAHRDVTVMTIASFTAIVAGFLARSMMWGSMMRDNRNQNAAVMFIVIMAVSVIVYFISYLLINGLSRYRELGADRGGALVTGKPSALASALTKITGEMARIPTKDIRAMEPVSNLAFAPAVAARKGFTLEGLMSTHPSLEKRLANLAKVAEELGQR